MRFLNAIPHLIGLSPTIDLRPAKNHRPQFGSSKHSVKRDLRKSKKRKQVLRARKFGQTRRRNGF